MRLTLLLIIASLISACSTPKPQRATLRDVDIIGPRQAQNNSATPRRSDDEIRKAYAEYLKHASKEDHSRITALNRLAQLEFELSEKLLKNKQDSDATDLLDDQLYNARLERTIELLSVSIRDYPNAKGNDKTYYQLANAYYQKGDYDKTIATLTQLVKKYPTSSYYIESQFRLAEAAFSRKNYRLAEDKYTDIIGSEKNVVFYEKALYKRGWARFKQEFYIEAIDDFMEVIRINRFTDYAKLNSTQKDEFDEYFRAVGLSFLYLGGPDELHSYYNNNKKFNNLYYVYASLSDIYTRQERYNDAVETMHIFARHNPRSVHLPESHLKVVEIWKTGGFSNKVNLAVAKLYKDFHPNAPYWHKQKNIDARIYKLVDSNMKDYILTVAANYHKEFQTTKKSTAFNNANYWYQNYLRHYRNHARKDNVHYLYGSLLQLNKNQKPALQQFELAAFESNTILNKDAAYEAITLTSALLKTNDDEQVKTRHRDRLIVYSTLYVQQYPNEKNTAGVIAHACENAYKANRFHEVITLSDSLVVSQNMAISRHINTIRAHAYFKLNMYKEAEDTYLVALEQNAKKSKNNQELRNSLALAIYYQGKRSATNDNIDNALDHYTRIADIAPGSEIAPTGLYDAIALAIQHEHWHASIRYIKEFQAKYPNHKYRNEVARKLSVAYLNSSQDIEAARELEKVAQTEKDNEYKIAALWKAAELYENKNETAAAIRSYEQYTRLFPRPYPQNIEAMNKLVTLNMSQNNERKANHWRDQIIKADRKTPNSLKTDRTRLLASSASLDLARNSHIRFSNIELKLPLKTSLRNKKSAMQNAVNLYGRASSYGVAETATEATYSIGEIYRSFSKSLLASERPRHLKGEELSQYQLLLEDQAFPFEEKAIEFYETNLLHVKDGVYDEWVQKSLTQLKKLFPVRYNREIQLDSYINVLH